jgi:hypothetical protein
MGIILQRGTSRGFDPYTVWHAASRKVESRQRRIWQEREEEGNQEQEPLSVDAT